MKVDVREAKNATEVKKELYKNKTVAKFSYYVGGSVYYTVELADGTYKFPMSTTKKRKFKLVEETSDGDVVLSEFTALGLAPDMGTTEFFAEMRGSELNRWVEKAIKNGEFMKVD